MKKRLLQILYLTLLATACASLKTVPDDTRQTVQEIVKNRDYQVTFSREHEMNSGLHYMTTTGDVRVHDDTLKYHLGNPLYNFVEVLQITDYRLSKLYSGETVITMTARDDSNPTAKQRTFRLGILNPDTLVVEVNDGKYIGKFTDEPWRYGNVTRLLPLTEEMLVPANPKEEVEKLLATRDYKVLFLLDRTQGQIMEYPASGHIQYSIFGHLHVQGDTLKYHFEDILLEQNEILPIRNYRQTQLESGDIEVSFSVTMKKRKKEEEVPFRITIQAPNKLWINVGKEAYRGSFTNIPWNYDIETKK